LHYSLFIGSDGAARKKVTGILILGSVYGSELTNNDLQMWHPSIWILRFSQEAVKAKAGQSLIPPENFTIFDF
jgi:hypothetical protein